MENRERIDQWEKEGKLSAEQIAILRGALKESEKKSRRIFEDVANKKNERLQKVNGFLRVGSLAAMAMIVLVSVFFVTQTQLSQGAGKALYQINLATGSIEAGEYTEAIHIINKAIRKAPQLDAGYMVLGTVYKLRYNRTKNSADIEEARKAFAKAKALDGFVQRRQKMGLTIFFIIIFLLFVVAAVCIVGVLLYNLLVNQEEGVNRSWAHLSTCYDKKHDLIPALIEVVRDYAQHEREVLEGVIAKRSVSTGEITQEAVEAKLEFDQTLTKALKGLYAVAEQYPDLKANESFTTLQHQIDAMETEIARARDKFNAKIRHYNAAVRVFPTNLIAGMCHFNSKQYYQLQEV